MRALLLTLSLAACSIPDQTFGPSQDANGAADATIDSLSSGGFIVNKQTLMITEGTSGTFTVSLARQPQSVVPTTISTTSAAVVATPASLDFTTTNWDQPVEVTVTPMIDKNDIAESSTVSIEGLGVAASSVGVKTLDPTVLGTAGWPPIPSAFTSTASVGGGSVVAYQVTISANTNLDRFGVFIPAGSGFYRMALYRDQANSPGALVAEIAARTPISNGENVFDVNPDVLVNTSTTMLFWIVIRTSASTAISYSTSAMGRTCVRQLDITNIDDAWPASFGASGCNNDFLMNLWITTYHQ